MGHEAWRGTSGPLADEQLPYRLLVDGGRQVPPLAACGIADSRFTSKRRAESAKDPKMPAYEYGLSTGLSAPGCFVIPASGIANTMARDRAVRVMLELSDLITPSQCSSQDDDHKVALSPLLHPCSLEPLHRSQSPNLSIRRECLWVPQ